jgi:cyclopropane fatty-acyl-phospholipid synthase-like methyltransferase
VGPAFVTRGDLSAITHGDRAFANPLSEADVDAAIAALDLPRGGTALDVGCGSGEVLARVKRRHAVTTMGIEPSHRWAARAHECVDLVHAAPFAEVDPMEGAWDLVVCIASSHAFGTWSDALAGLRRLVRPGGAALVGEGFWQRPPSASYLEVLRANADELPDRDGLLDGARRAGWTVVAERVASAADWADYEETLIGNGERALAEHDDGALREWVGRARARWEHPDGRDTLGFALLTLRAA